MKYIKYVLLGIVAVLIIISIARFIEAQKAIAGYAEAANGEFPRYRIWNSSASPKDFGAEKNATSVGLTKAGITNQLIKSSPKMNISILVSQTNASTLDLRAQIFNFTAETWSGIKILATAMVNETLRGYDLCFENSRGDGMVFWENDTSADASISYMRYNITNSTWSQEFRFSLGGGTSAAYNWVRCVPKNNSNDIMVLALNNSRGLVAAKWDGTNLTNITTLINFSSSAVKEPFDFAWESVSGDGLVVYGNGSGVVYQVYGDVNGSWSTPTNFVHLGGAPDYISACADPNGNYVGMIVQDAGDDVNVGMWDGNAVQTTPAAPSEDAITERVATRNTDCAWENSGSQAIFVWVDSGSLVPESMAYNQTPDAWNGTALTGGDSVINSWSDDVESLVLAASYNTDEMLLIGEDLLNDVETAWWNNSMWSSPTTASLETTESWIRSIGVWIAWERYFPAAADNTPPRIQNAIETPDPVSPNNTIELNVSCTDNDCNAVIVQIQQPNGSLVNRTMSNVSNNITSYFNRTNFTHIIGTYNLSFYANDSSGNANRTATSSYVVQAAVTRCGGVYDEGAGGDFNISTGVICTNETVNVTGSLNVLASGNLTLINATIRISPTSELGRRVTVINGSSGMHMYSTADGTSKLRSDNGYNFTFMYKGNELEVFNSSIEDVWFLNISGNNTKFFGANISYTDGEAFYIYGQNNRIFYSNLSRVAISANGSAVITIASGISTNNTISHNLIRDAGPTTSNADPGILILSQNNTIYNNTLRDLFPSGSGEDGIRYNNRSQNISSNTLTKITDDGISSTIAFYDTSSIENNIMRDCSTYGITLASGGGINISNNFINCTGSGTRGINLATGANTTLVVGNNVSRSERGINILSNDNNISHNHVRYSTANAVVFGAIGDTADNNLFRFNNVTDSNASNSEGVISVLDGNDNSISDNLLVRGGSLDPTTGGVVFSDSDNNLTGNIVSRQVTSGTDVGISIVTGVTGINIVNNTINQTDYGILSPGTGGSINGINIVNNTIHNITFDAISIEGNNWVVEGNTLENVSRRAVSIDVSEVELSSLNWSNLTGNIIANSTTGIYVVSGVDVKSINNTFINNTIDFNISNLSIASSVHSLNNSFNRTGVDIFGGADNLFNVSWFVRVNVTNGNNNPVASANATVKNATEGFVVDDTTDSAGMTRVFQIIEVYQNTTTNNKTLFSPHNFTASNTSLSNSTQKFISKSQIAIVFLSVPPPGDSTPPDITEPLETSDPINPNNTIELNISCRTNDCTFVNIQLTQPNGSLVNLSMTNLSSNITKFFNRTSYTHLIGNYTINYYANDTTGNANRTVQSDFLVNDSLYPNVTTATETPDPINPNRTIELNITVTDNVEVGSVIIQITQPNNSLINLSTTLNNGRYFNRTAFTHLNGTYNLSFYANDTTGLVNRTITSNYQVLDDVVPNVTNALETPDPVGPNATIELNVTVVDNVAVSNVIAMMTFPNASLRNYTMGLATGSIYTNRSTNTQILGTYNITYYTNDTNGNKNATTFTQYNVSDTSTPNVTSLIVTPLEAEYGTIREVNVTVADDVEVGSVIVELLNMSTNYTTTLISGVYTNRSVNSSVVGNNTVRIYANDTSGNKNNTEKRGFNVFVTPTVSLVNSIPSLVINDTEIKLNASIVFNGTGSVIAEIKYPNGTFWQNTSLSNPSGDEWNGTVPWNWNVTGTYNFTILANDSNGGRNYTEKYYYTPFLNITTPNGNAIDGNFSDWENKTNTTDEAGDIFGSGPSSHDMINVKIDNNGTHMFFFINVSGNIDNSDGTRYYRIYLSNGSQAAPNGNDTAPNNLERTAANYTYRIQINGSYFNGVDPCGIYNWTGSRTANCSFKNGSKEIEAMVAFDDINSSNVRIYHNITFETGNSTDRYDVAPNYKSFIQFVTGDAVLGVIGFVYPVNNTVYFVGGNYPYSFNFTCNYSVTGGGTASIVANWSYKIATFASNYQLVNGSDSNLSGNSTNGTITANGIAAGSYSFRQEVNTTGRNETFILRCEAVSGTTRLSTEERTIYVNRTPDYNGSVRVYGAFDGVRNATTLEGGTVTLLNDRRWNLSMQFLMNQTDTIPNLTVHNIILSGANFSNNISLVADELNGSIVDANLSNGTVYSNKTWKEYNFTDINGSFGNPAVQLHNFSNNSVFDQEVEKTYRADGESEANATSYKAIAYDDGDYINMTLGDDSNRVTARYLFKLDENEEAIDNFTVRWVGSGGVGIGALRSVQAFLFAWNFTEMNWTKLGSTTASLDGNITYSISGRSGIREFINESSGEITFVVRSSNFILPSEVALGLPSNVLTDYIQLTTGLNSSSVHWHPRIGYAYSDIENNEGFNLTYRLDPQNVTDNMSINLTFGSRGKAQNFSYTINLINPPAGAANNAPYLRSMNLLPTNPNTTDQFNCTFVVQDNESTSLDVNVTWYNGTAWFNSSIITVTNASNASRFLEAGVQARPNNWTCSIKATDGGGLLSDNRNDSAVVVNSQPTAVGLRDPLNDNHTTNRTPFFYWTNTTDADDDSNFTFTINLTCYLIAGGLCSPNDNKLVNTSDTGINLTNSQQLRFFFDDGAFYNWTVTAYDNNGTSGLSGINMSRNISIDVVVDVTMPNSTVQFGNKSIGNSDDTTDNSPQPAAIQNNGNSFIDVNESGVQADIDMWVTDAVPTSNYQFRMDNISEERGSFNSTNTPLTFVSVNATTSLAINDLNHSETNDSAEIEFSISVPLSESPGNKNSLVTFTGYYAGIND